MEGVVVSRQILLAALAARRRPVLETFAERLQSASAAFHNQQARNEVRTSSVSTSPSGFKAFELFSFYSYTNFQQFNYYFSIKLTKILSPEADGI
jgi:hypothetical protein